MWNLGCTSIVIQIYAPLIQRVYYTNPLYYLHWCLNLNNTLYILSHVLMFPDKGFSYMNVRLRMSKYCYSNLNHIYAKGYQTNLFIIFYPIRLFQVF